MAEQRRSTYGPYNVLQLTGPEGKKLESFPYADFIGSQLMISVADNAAKTVNQGGSDSRDALQFMVIAEIGIWGQVQGQSTLLKRQAVRMLSGSMLYSIPDGQPWDKIEVRARNMTGGRRGTPTGGVLQPAANQVSLGPGQPVRAPSLLLGYQINVTIAIQRQQGS